MGDRRALVIGSQCRGLQNSNLSFLPERARRLYDVLTDPARGGCSREDSSLVLDPSLRKMSRKLTEAIEAAAAAEATLVVAFVGHADSLPDPAGGSDLYLLPNNGGIPPDSETGFLLGQRMKELLTTRGAGLDGLILIVDACHAGEGAIGVAQRAMGIIAASGLRLEMLTSTFKREARSGCFSQSLIELLENGMPDKPHDYIISENALDHAANRCCQQEPPLKLSVARGRRIQSDPSLWLSRNAPTAWRLSGTPTGSHVVELTRHYQLTSLVDRVLGRMATHRVTVVTGETGYGKSALVAALCRPDLAPRVIPRDFIHGVAFTAITSTAVEVARTLVQQLRGHGILNQPDFTLDGFTKDDILDAKQPLQRMVIDPIRRLAPSPAERTRLAIDGLDQADPLSRSEIADAIRILADPRTGPPNLRLLITLRPESLHVLPPELRETTISMEAPCEEHKIDLARAYGVPEELVRDVASGTETWLEVKLMSSALELESHSRPFTNATGKWEPK